jgi:hypothetical protein
VDGSDERPRAQRAARLVTKDRVVFSYGLVQSRIRLPSGRGTWPAFWVFDHDFSYSSTWPWVGPSRSAPTHRRGSPDHARRLHPLRRRIAPEGRF